MKTKHDPTCMILVARTGTAHENAGVCTCGFGAERLREGDPTEMYSAELVAVNKQRRQENQKVKV